MAAKGSILKQEIIEKILETFPGSFLYNDGKEIRINGVENGERLQIKVSLTCAKIPVEGGDDSALPGETKKIEKTSIISEVNEKIPDEPSAEEKERLAMLLNKLGL